MKHDMNNELDILEKAVTAQKVDRYLMISQYLLPNVNVDQSGWMLLLYI